MSRFTHLILLVPLTAADLPSGAVARFGSPSLRHAERPLALALNASGTRLASGGPDGSLKLWDTSTGRLLGRYHVIDGYVSSIAMSDDGSLIAARFGDGNLHLVETATMTKKRTIAFPNVEEISLSRDGRLVAGTAPREPIRVFETTNGLDRIQGLVGVAIAFSPNGARIARADTGQTIRVTDTIAGQTVFACTHLSADRITSLSWSADGELLLSADAGETGRIRLWRLGRDQPEADWLANGGYAVFAGDRVVGLNDRSMTVWDRAGRVLRTSGSNISILAVSGDGKVAASAGTEPRISLWDVDTGKMRWIDPDDLGVIRDLAAGPRGELYVAAERGFSTWVPGAKPRTLFATNSSSLAAIGDRTTASLAEGKLTIRRHSDSVQPDAVIGLGTRADAVALAISPHDSSPFVSFGDRTIRQYEPNAGKQLRSWNTPSPVMALAPTPDGKDLVGVGRDGFVRAWSLSGDPNTTPEPRWSLRVARSLRPAVAVSRDSRTVAATSVVRLEVFDVKTGNRLFQGDRTWHDGPFQAVTFSPDGRFVVAGMQGSAGGVSVWEVATGSFVRRFEGGNGSVTKLLALPSCRIVSASVDDTILVWDLTPKFETHPTRTELERAWEKLIEFDGSVGLECERTLAAGAEEAVRVIDAGLRRIVKSQTYDLKNLADLGSPEFAKREAATKALRDRGVASLANIVRVNESSDDPEVVQRTEKLIAELLKKGIAVPQYGKFGDALRVHRAVWALEALAPKHPRALTVLESLPPSLRADNATGAIARVKAKN